jgi:hypothetical protein
MGLSSSPLISDCIFDGNGADNFGGAGVGCYDSQALITGCVFLDNFGYSTVHSYGSNVTVRNCTFALSRSLFGSGAAVQVGPGDPPQEAPGQILLERTIIAFGDGLAVICLPQGTPTLSCCDIYGNAGGDWIGCIAGQLGVDGNFALDPQFCDLLTHDLHLNGSSPCLPGNHPQGAPCDLIGALEAGCATAVENTTWGAIKSRF